MRLIDSHCHLNYEGLVERQGEVLAAAASYASLYLLLLWQAMRGQSLVAPDAAAFAAIGIWAVVTALSLCWIGVRSRRAAPDGADWKVV